MIELNSKAYIIRVGGVFAVNFTDSALRGYRNCNIDNEVLEKCLFTWDLSKATTFTNERTAKGMRTRIENLLKQYGTNLWDVPTVETINISLKIDS